MDELIQILDMIYGEWGINVSVFEKTGKILYDAAEKHRGENTTFWSKEEISAFFDQLERDRSPKLRVEYRVCYLTLQGPEQTLIIVGPVFDGEQAVSARRDFLHARGIKDRNYLIPQKNLKELMRFFKIAVRLISGSFISEGELIADFEMLKNIPEQMDEAFSTRDHKEVSRYGHEVEKQWIQGIREGKLVYFKDNQFSFREVGEMVEKNSLKQSEYMAIAALTLASRAAVDGGLDWNRAMELMDIFLRKIADCKNTLEIVNILNQSVEYFAEQVRISKTIKRNNPYVKQSMEYIDDHIREKIGLHDVARTVGLNANYLSQLFSENVGMTMGQYIRKQKLYRAGNMLKYSDLTLSMISAYYSFSSHSHFTDLFRREYGMTPIDYRRKYQRKD